MPNPTGFPTNAVPLIAFGVTGGNSLFLVKSRSFLWSLGQPKCILLFISCSPNHKASSELDNPASNLSLSLSLFSFEKTSSPHALDDGN